MTHATEAAHRVHEWPWGRSHIGGLGRRGGGVGGRPQPSRVRGELSGSADVALQIHAI